MKKLLTTILIIMMSQMSVLANITDVDMENSNDKLSMRNPLPIEDELLKSEKFRKIMPVYVKDNTPIVDDLIEVEAESGATIKLWAEKKGQYEKVNIDDELITQKFRDRVGSISILKRRPKVNIEDEFAKQIDRTKISAIRVKNKYDFTKSQVPVQLKIIKNLSTKNAITEGDSILFKTIKDVMINGINLPKGTKIVGRVETISDSDKMGVPANLVVDNFYVKNHPEINFYGSLTKTGANRALWVYPLYQAGNLVLYVAGFVFVPIHGGHAKFSTDEVYTVFYEPQ